MSQRLDQDREKELQPKRIKYAKDQLAKLGIDVIAETDNVVIFMWKNERIQFFPYSGWHTGKSITDGRGINKLLKQLKIQ